MICSLREAYYTYEKRIWHFWSYGGNVQGWRQANVKNRRMLSPVRQTARAVFQSLPLLRLADLSWRLKTAPYPQICALLLKGVTVPEITRKQNFKYQLQGHDTKRHLSLIREIPPRKRGFGPRQNSPDGLSACRAGSHVLRQKEMMAWLEAFSQRSLKSLYSALQDCC